jgi:hypothetical protein
VLPLLSTVIVTPAAFIDDRMDREIWASGARDIDAAQPSTDIEPIGKETIHGIFGSPSLRTIVFDLVGDPYTGIPPCQWQTAGTMGTIVNRYMGDEDKHLLVLRNLSRSQYRRRTGDPSEDDELLDGPQEAVFDEDSKEQALLYEESDYRWRTAMSYGQRSIPTWLGLPLLGALGTSVDDLELYDSPDLDASAKEMLAEWEGKGHPWEKPAGWEETTTGE